MALFQKLEVGEIICLLESQFKYPGNILDIPR